MARSSRANLQPASRMRAGPRRARCPAAWTGPRPSGTAGRALRYGTNRACPRVNPRAQYFFSAPDLICSFFFAPGGFFCRRRRLISCTGFAAAARRVFFLPVKSTGNPEPGGGRKLPVFWNLCWAACPMRPAVRARANSGLVRAAARPPQRLPCPGCPGGARARFWRLTGGRCGAPPPGVRAAAGSFPGPRTPVRAAAPGQPAAVRRTGRSRSLFGTGWCVNRQAVPADALPGRRGPACGRELRTSRHLGTIFIRSKWR